MEKNRSGITLIALIITVIVLLILAGVAISISINGGDLFGKTSEAREKWNISVENENSTISNIIQILDSMNDDGMTGIIVSHNGQNVDISKISSSQIANYYGDDVVNYNTGGNYQLLYVDNEGKYGEKGRAYIQNKEYLWLDYDFAGTVLTNRCETTGLDNTNSLVYKLNPAWAAMIGNKVSNLTTEELASTSIKYKAVAYLCNTQNWNSRYVTTEDQEKGIWAIGGASVEMFCESYNDRLNPETKVYTKPFITTYLR